MDSIELTWLIPTFLQVTGLAISLAIIGFGYDRALQERKSFTTELTQGAMAGWLAFAGVIFAAGMVFTQIPWGYKAIAIVLAALLIGLAWTSPRASRVEKPIIPKQKPTLKSISWLLVKVFFIVFLLLILVWWINLGWHAVHLYGLARNIQEDPTQIQADKILSLAEEAAGDVDSIYYQLSPLFPLFNSFQSLPVVGPYLGQIEPLMSFADGLTQAGKELATGLEPVLEGPPAERTALSLPERVSQAVQSGQAHFVIAAQDIDQASQVRSRIRPELMPASVRTVFLKLDGKFNLLEAGVQILQAAPKLLGNDQAQSYLVLAQNRDELRGTGGFISGIGLLTLEDGRILKFNLGDSYLVDDFTKSYPPPPEPLKRFMLADYWVTRDANWSPDFPSAAQQAQTLYSLSTGVQTQGVIAFNQLAVKRMLEVIGPVDVAGTDKPVTEENVEEYMRQAWAPAPDEGLNEEWWLHRKDFMQQLGSAVLDHAMKSDNQEQLLNLAKTMVELLDQGQIIIYFNDPTAQAALEESGWNGAVRPGNSDYLYLVDSNVGFNKVDTVITRSVTYQVDLSNLNQPTGKVTLAYQHKGSGDILCKQEISYGSGTYQDMQQRCYLDFWRVYVPGGSELNASTTQPVPAEQLLNGVGWSGQVETLAGEAGTQVWAGLMMLPLAQTSQISISFNLPSSIIHTVDANLQEYSLRVQVQPGLEGLPFQLEITLPKNANLVNPGEGWKQSSAQIWSWQGLLVQTTELKIAIQTIPNP